MATHLSPVIAAAIAASLLSSPVAYAQQSEHPKQSMSNLGTLTCTFSGAPEKPQTDIKLSCNFKTSAGVARDYQGVASRQGAADFPPGKHVLVWSVLGPATADKAPTLNGTFRGKTGGTGIPVLVGGENGSVQLEPVTGTAQIDAAAALTVLSLSLAPTRA